jgi:hypothetical protein
MKKLKRLSFTFIEFVFATAFITTVCIYITNTDILNPFDKFMLIIFGTSFGLLFILLIKSEKNN